MSQNTSRCFACLSPIPTVDCVCPHCGHDNRIRDNGVGFLPACALQNQYLVGKALGRGGFGITYIGYDLILDHVVAIKEYFPASMAVRLSNSFSLSAFNGCEDQFKDGCERAFRESRTVAKLNHIPGVVQIYNAFRANNTIYIVMEYVDGITLSKYIKQKGGSLPWPDLLKLMNPVMDTLGKLHSMNVAHRDIKPENIMIRRENNEPVLLDFGAAHVITEATMSKTSSIVSAGYTPLEQYSPTEAQDGRVDQYALCSTMLHALTGKCPPEAPDRLLPNNEHAEYTVSCTPENKLTEKARRALLRGFSIHAKDRFETIGALQDALNPPKKPKLPMIIALCAALAVCAAFAGVTLISLTSHQPLGTIISSAFFSTSASSFRTTENEDGTLTITKYTGDDATVVIPELIDMKTVTAIGEKAFMDCTAITSVSFPNTIVTIDTSAFEGCSSLDNVVLPDSLIELNGFAFDDCDSLTRIEIPAALDSIGANPFAYCDSLQEITVAPGCEWITVKDGLLIVNGNKIISAIHTLPSHVIVPEGITHLRGNAFSGCEGMQTLSFPSSLTEFNGFVFWGCPDLKEVIIPDSVTALDSKDFYGCSSLTSITIPASVTTIGEEAFAECPNLTLQVARGSYAETYAKENGIPYLTDSSATPAASFETSENEDGTLTITAYTGADTNIVIPDVIGGKTVTIIGEEAFLGNTEITSVSFPNTILTIGTSAFEGCTSLTNVVLPDSLTDLDGFAFDDCDSLTSIEIPAALNSIGSNPFAYCDNLQEITVAPGCNWIKVIDGMMIVNGERVISAIHNLPSHVVVPEGVDTIRGNAFSGCTGMQTIEIPTSVVELGGFVFWGCPDLKEVVIPDSVTKLGNKVFYNCENLVRVVIPASVTTMGNEVFGECPNLTVEVTGGSYAETYVSENGVNYSIFSYSNVPVTDASFFTTGSVNGKWGIQTYTGTDSIVHIPAKINNLTIRAIADNAFSGSPQVKTVIIPDTITEISVYAFDGCSNLTLVGAEGSAVQNIAKQIGADFHSLE